MKLDSRITLEKIERAAQWKPRQWKQRGHKGPKVSWRDFSGTIVQIDLRTLGAEQRVKSLWGQGYGTAGWKIESGGRLRVVLLRRLK